MKAHSFFPRKLDIGAFIESGETLSGDAPVTAFERLAQGLAQDADAAALPLLRWTARGRVLPQRVGGPQLWLDLTAHAELAWECQRCLQPVVGQVAIDRHIRFVKDEAQATELDADSDDDVLALSRQFDLLALVEDELIMAQPLVPRHETCPTDVAAAMADPTETTPDGVKAVPAISTGAEPPEGAEDASGPQAQKPSSRPNPFAVLATLKKDKS